MMKSCQIKPTQQGLSRLLKPTCVTCRILTSAMHFSLSLSTTHTRPESRPFHCRDLHTASTGGASASPQAFFFLPSSYSSSPNMANYRHEPRHVQGRGDAQTEPHGSLHQKMPRGSRVERAREARRGARKSARAPAARAHSQPVTV